LDPDSESYSEAGYRWGQRELAKFSVAVLFPMLPISIVAALAQNYFSGGGNLIQPPPWAGLWEKSLRGVARSEAFSARRTQGRCNGSLFLIMRDGIGFDIMTWARPAVRAYPDIVRALEGVEFAFSSEGVSPDCKLPYAHLLTKRP